MSTLAIIELLGGALKALASVAPDIAALFTGGVPVEELIEQARQAARALPVRSGDDGEWAADLDRRVSELPEDPDGE